MNIRLLLILTVAITAASIAISPVYADPVNGNLKYTTSAGGQNVWSIDFNSDGASFINFMNDMNLCSTQGADGIAGNPQNPDLLIVGGQANRINTCQISAPNAVTSIASLGSVFHLEVTDSTTVFGNAFFGSTLVSHTINPDGSLVGPGTLYTLSTAPGCNQGDTVVTQLIDTPSGFFYALNGIYGTLTFTGATTAETCRLHGAGGSLTNANLPGAHGGVYDLFTDSVITMGNNCLTQLNAVTGAIIGSNCFAGGNFDQGTVDGQGHAYIAQNPNIFFLDYAASGLVNAPTFSTSTFVKNAMDDVAPLVGEGSTDPCPPGTTGTPPDCVPDEEQCPPGTTGTPPDCEPIVVGGEFLPIETTSLLLAAASSPAAWLTSLTIVALGIGAYVFTRNSNNMRNIKVILRDYLDRL